MYSKLASRSWYGLILGLLLALALPVAAQQSPPAAPSGQTPLRLGILPFNSTLALMKTHQPIRQFLQARLGRPVELYTAPDFLTYLQEQLQGNYDLIITPPHFGLMAIEKGYVPLFHYRARMEPIIVVRKEDGIKDQRDLQGKRVAMANRLAFVPIVGLKWLADKGMKPERDFTMVEKPTHGAAIAAVAVGDADAAITTSTLLGQVPDDIRQRVRFISTGIRLPHVMTMAHQRLGPAEIKRIKAALAELPDSPEGKVFFNETAYLGYEDILPSELDLQKPYRETLERLLELQQNR